MRTSAVAEADPFYLVEGRFVGIVDDFALVEDHWSGAFYGEVDCRELPFRADSAYVGVGLDELFITDFFVGQSAGLLNIVEGGHIALIELLVRNERVVEAIVEVEDRFVVVGFKQRELFRRRRSGGGDCLLEGRKLCVVRVCDGCAALPAVQALSCLAPNLPHRCNISWPD